MTTKHQQSTTIRNNLPKQQHESSDEGLKIILPGNIGVWVEIYITKHLQYDNQSYYRYVHALINQPSINQYNQSNSITYRRGKNKNMSCSTISKILNVSPIFLK